MPVTAFRYCATAGCPEKVSAGRCSKHKQGDNYRLYRRAKWRGLRKQMLDSEPFCRDCVVTLAKEMHHIQKPDVAPHLIYTPSNLVPLCRPCHRLRTLRGE